MGLAYGSPSTFLLNTAFWGPEPLLSSPVLETSPQLETGTIETSDAGLQATFVYGPNGETFVLDDHMAGGQVEDVTDEGIKTGLRSLGIFTEI